MKQIEGIQAFLNQLPWTNGGQFILPMARLFPLIRHLIIQYTLLRPSQSVLPDEGSFVEPLL